MAEAKTTTNHDEIRSWAESRGGRPARVRDTGNGDDPGSLGIDFRGQAEGVDQTCWDAGCAA